MVAQNDYNILGLDYGEKRIGVALAHAIARLPHPLKIVPNDAMFFEVLDTLIETENVREMVVGLPVPFSTTENDQTRAIRQFGEQVERRYGLPVSYVNEALTSVESRSTTPKLTKGEYIDDQAAAAILERYLAGEQELGGI